MARDLKSELNRMTPATRHVGLGDLLEAIVAQNNVNTAALVWVKANVSGASGMPLTITTATTPPSQMVVN